MSLRLQIRREKTGPWSLTGLPHHRAAVEFDNLAEGLDYAERQCDAAPAVIELVSDGIYVAVSQEEGWPHRLCRSTATRFGHDGDPSAPATGDWLKRCVDRLGHWWHRAPIDARQGKLDRPSV